MKWCEIFSIGTHRDSKGRERTWTEGDLEKIKLNFERVNPDVPICCGHPVTNSPAYGWVEQMKVAGGKLYASFKDVVPEFADAVRKGWYRTRSISLNNDLVPRHIAFLGAQAPAVKGMEQFCFVSGEDEITIDFNEANNSDDKMAFASELAGAPGVSEPCPLPKNVKRHSEGNIHLTRRISNDRYDTCYRFFAPLRMTKGEMLRMTGGGGKYIKREPVGSNTYKGCGEYYYENGVTTHAARPEVVKIANQCGVTHTKESRSSNTGMAFRPISPAQRFKKPAQKLEKKGESMNDNDNLEQLCAEKDAEIKRLQGELEAKNRETLKKEYEDFCDSAVSGGNILPSQRQDVMDILLGGADASIDFADGSNKSLNEIFKNFVLSLKQMNFEEIADRNEAVKESDVNFSDAEDIKEAILAAQKEYSARGIELNPVEALKKVRTSMG